MIWHVKRAIKAVAGPVARAATSPRAGLSPHTWDLTVDSTRGLCFEGIPLRDLLSQWGSPLHVVQGARLAQNMAALLERERSSARACEVFYSCKTNPVPGVLQALREEGAGIEVISPYELWLAFRLGFRPEAIIYNGPAKSEESLREAIGRGVRLVNINHREEIPIVARIARELGRRPTVGLRVVAPGAWGGQFGVSITNGDALEAYREAVATGVLDVVAMHAHRGSPIHSAKELHAFVDAVLDFSLQLRSALGLSVRILDFGGSLAVATTPRLSTRAKRLNRAFGVPIPAPNPALTLSLADYGRILLERVAAHTETHGWEMPQVFVEPGRALTANAQFLLTRVIAIKKESGRVFAVLDAGINLAETVQHEYHQLFTLDSHGKPADVTYALAGPICTPADVLYPAVRLPELQVGDALAIMDAGAYFVPFATSFSFPQPAIVMVRGGGSTLLRRAETFEHLVALDDGCVDDESEP